MYIVCEHFQSINFKLLKQKSDMNSYLYSHMLTMVTCIMTLCMGQSFY